MKLNSDIINDLIELNELGLASKASQELIKKYLKDNPNFSLKQNEINSKDINFSTEEIDEMNILNKTKKTLRNRMLLFAFAIFFTLLPLSFGNVSWSKYEGVHWLWIDNPEIAVIIGLFALFLWLQYYRLNKKVNSAIN